MDVPFVVKFYSCMTVTTVFAGQVMGPVTLKSCPSMDIIVIGSFTRALLFV